MAEQVQYAGLLSYHKKSPKDIVRTRLSIGRIANDAKCYWRVKKDNCSHYQYQPTRQFLEES